MKKAGYGLSDNGPSRKYRSSVIAHMKDRDWSINRTARHFHHSWTTIQAWLKEYDEAHRTDASPVVMYGNSDDVVTWAPEREKCLECIRLQAQLEVYKAMVQQLLGVSA